MYVMSTRGRPIIDLDCHHIAFLGLLEFFFQVADKIQSKIHYFGSDAACNLQSN